MDNTELNEWAKRSVRAMLRRLLQGLASEYERAAKELRAEAR